MFDHVAEWLDAQERAQEIRRGFDRLAEEIASRIGDRRRPRVLLLEWFDPPFCAGHWTPELIELAGGVEVIGKTGEKSRRLTWQEVQAADPEVILVSACGFTIERTLSELDILRSRPEWTQLRAVREGRVSVTDGSAYFSRPGPRSARKAWRSPRR